NPRRPPPAPWRSCPSPSGGAVTLAACRIRGLRCAPLVHRVATAPPWTQDSLRVGGSPLPDKDLHLARDAKLFLARERWASGAANGRSEVRAEAIGGRLQALVGRHLSKRRGLCVQGLLLASAPRLDVRIGHEPLRLDRLAFRSKHHWPQSVHRLRG